MERPPLTTVLASVLTAAVENTNRPALLATVIPMPRRSPDQPDPDSSDGSDSRDGPEPAA